MPNPEIKPRYTTVDGEKIYQTDRLSDEEMAQGRKEALAKEQEIIDKLKEIDPRIFNEPEKEDDGD